MNYFQLVLLIGVVLVVMPGNLKLIHFDKSEFGVWWPDISPDVLKKLDKFRELWGAPVQISPDVDSLGRHAGDSGSMHNVDKWGKVRAVDVFPMVFENGQYRYMKTRMERLKALELAKQAGFTGIGLYVDTSPGNMLHIDNRPGGKVAMWSRVAGGYLDIRAVV